MIIVEGPDGSGKTTMVNWLKEELRIPVAPRVVDKETNAMVNLQSWVDENLDQGPQPMIFDRHRLISEPIYGPIMRDDAQPGFSELTWLGPRLDRFYNEIKPFIIYCLPDLDVVLENLKGDTDNIAVVDRAERIYSSYVSRISLDLTFAPRRPMVWNYKRSLLTRNTDSLIYKVREYLQDQDFKIKDGTPTW